MQDKPLIVPAAFLGGAGHWLQVERTEETNALILDFLKQVT